jgi:hypothetical protein
MADQQAARKGEVDGENYHFASKEEILELRDTGKMIETDEIHGNLYGTSVAAVASDDPHALPPKATSTTACLSHLHLASSFPHNSIFELDYRCHCNLTSSLPEQKGACSEI